MHANLCEQDAIILTHMATLNLVLDKRRVKKNGTYPVVFKLTANRKQAFIPTGISVNEQEYDEKNSLVINSPKLN